jgi:transposase
MNAVKSRKVKTDRRDARALCEACELDLPEAFGAQMAPLLEVMRSVNAELKAAGKALAEQAKTHKVAKRLCTAAGVGPVTVISFEATVDRVERFAHAKHVRAYLGLVPRELSSGEKQRRGHITKAGNRRMRALLVEASWQLLRSRRADTEALRAWAYRIAIRRCKRIAAVALARKFPGILTASVQWPSRRPPAVPARCLRDRGKSRAVALMSTESGCRVDPRSVFFQSLGQLASSLDG